ncbi:unnamed protein product [Macrosiphum euphorbiae]|uniref:Uncharacterized protein n=1 Tax=Macrosiphum euphorbiae TaxID=13131 RepID=A0AAV0X7L1_9HEMI|nr:unnamed protein product [Macrosiphum euphorbiae]
MLLHNPSAFWKFIKELNQYTTINSTLRLDNETADSPTYSANLFSKYFSSVFSTFQSSFSDFSKNNNYPYYLPYNKYFTNDDVLTVLYYLKNNFSNVFLGGCSSTAEIQLYFLYLCSLGAQASSRKLVQLHLF